MIFKILIKRRVPKSKKAQLIPLLRKLRILAMDQPGYITGETLKRFDHPGETLVISTWRSVEDWRQWVVSPERTSVQAQIDFILGNETEYEAYMSE